MVYVVTVFHTHFLCCRHISIPLVAQKPPFYENVGDIKIATEIWR